jgi:transcriptional regulator with XRE-family HTH domain
MHKNLEKLIWFQDYFELPTSRLAGLLGVSESSVRRWRSGKTNPSPACLDKIHKLLKAARDAAEKLRGKSSE